MIRPSIAIVRVFLGKQTLRIAFLSAFAILTALSNVAQTPQEIILKANQAYNDGHFEAAAEAYSGVADQGLASPELFYNLGNAWFKLNDMPRAILWYERARKLDPGNENIHYNLQVANSRIADKIDPLPVLFYVRWYQDLIMLFSLNIWASLTIAGFIATLALILMYRISGNILWRKAGFWGGIIGLSFTLLTVLFSLSAWKQTHNVPEAIVFEPTTTVKSSPDEESIDLFVLHEGTKVRLLDKIGDWYEVRIANGSVGWLPGQSLEEI